MTGAGPRTLVCVYTCERDRPFLDAFYQSPAARLLAGWRHSRVIEVYADARRSRPELKDGCLTVDSPEEYEALSLKTWKMMRYCASHLPFDFLVKIDVTTVLQDLSSPAYEGRVPIEQDALVRFLDEFAFDGDYHGLKLQKHATRNNIENWGRKKGGEVQFEAAFGDEQVPAYFSGKCYIVSHGFAGFIGRHGEELAREHAQYLLGSEDLMIGRLYQRFCKSMD